MKSSYTYLLRVTVAISIIAAVLCLRGLIYPETVLSPDQLGQWYFDRGEYAQAADLYEDAFRRGIAWYEAGDFETAASSFAGIGTAESSFNYGNSLMFLGKYEDAAKQFDAALALRPGWQNAIDNQKIALARAEMVKATGGEAGDQRIGADEIVFDKSKKSGGQDTDANDVETTDDSVQEMWLRRIQTKPSTFLKSKFAFQAAEQESAP